MVDVFLIIVAIIMSAVVFFCCGMLVIVMSHPDDGTRAKLPKAITVFGLWLAFISVLLLPYDVANQKGAGGGIPVSVIWQIVFMTTAAMVSFVIPYAFWYYESDTIEDDGEFGEDHSDNPKKKSGCLSTQAGTALCYTLCFFVVFTTILVIMYAFLHNAIVPVTRIAQSPLSVVSTSAPFYRDTAGCVQQLDETIMNCITTSFDWTIPVTFPVYVIAFLAFLGWWFFSLFAGVGLISLPMDLINDFRTRPKKMTTREKMEMKGELAERAATLLRLGDGMYSKFREIRVKSSSAKRKEFKLQSKFESHFYLLKRDVDIYNRVLELRNQNPLIPIGKLFCGIIGIILSLFWILHMALFMLPETPIDDFLNVFFIDLESVGNGSFPLFGVLAFALFSFYLLWAVVAGNFKLGIRLIIFTLYPMEYGKTRMNAFLANTWVILLCSVPTVQFCTLAFPIYARYTDVDMVFGTQIQYLQFLTEFWKNNVFIIALLCINFLTIVYLLVCPKDRNADVEAEIAGLTEERNKQMKGLTAI